VIEPVTQLFCTNPGPVLIDSAQAPVLFDKGLMGEVQLLPMARAPAEAGLNRQQP